MSQWAERHWLLFSEKTNLVTGPHSVEVPGCIYTSDEDHPKKVE